MKTTDTPAPLQRSSKRASLPIVETFHSVQGEGLWSGCSAFFIRLAGCDVGCPWCDTKHSWPLARHPQQAIAALVQAAQQARPQFVVITGGEPLMHDLTPLTQALQTAGLRCHLETSGAHPLTGQFDWITLSPKRYKPPLTDILPQVQELKVVVATTADLAWAEQWGDRVPPQAAKVLQPEWFAMPDSQYLVFDYVRQHPQWRLSLQTHKFMEVR